MDPDFERVEIGGEVVVPGSSLFVESTGEVVWVASIEDDHIRVETVEDAGRITVDRFERKLASEEIVVEPPPAGFWEPS